MSREERYLELGVVVRPHGIRGEVVLRPHHEPGEALAALRRLWLTPPAGEAREARLTRAEPLNQGWKLKLAGVDDRTTAESLAGTRVAAFVEDLPPLTEGEHYVDRLLGAAVVDDATGERLGALTAVVETGAHDCYIVRGDDGVEIWLPAVEAVVRSIDEAAGEIRVRPPEGLVALYREEAATAAAARAEKAARPDRPPRRGVPRQTRAKAGAKHAGGKGRA